MRTPLLVAAMAATTLLHLDARAYCQDKRPTHLHEAESLVRRLNLKNTDYRHGEPEVIWDGASAASHADCSGFIDALLIRSYGYNKEDFKSWFGKSRPTAANYHDAIVTQKGFSRIERPQDVREGDFLAVKYLVLKENTGHVMLAAGAAKRMDAQQPVIAGTIQWELKVIDSSESGHGITDTRHHKGENNKDHTGLGAGVLRIYSHDNGQIAGWSWSTLKVSEFKQPKDEHLVIGRLLSNHKP